MIFIGMTIANNMDLNTVDFIKIEKTEDERDEEKTIYNNFLNFMTDIIVKYGLNEEEQ